MEGEALAASWALKNTSHFTLGCRNLILAVDHKPLLKLFGDRELREIENPRLLNFKEKTLPYRFKVIHVPCKKNRTADSFSRNPVSDYIAVIGYTETYTQAETDQSEMLELSLPHHLAAVCDSLTAPQAFTWEELQNCSETDHELKKLHSFVTSGVPEEKAAWPEEIVKYYSGREYLDTVGGVVTYKGKLVVPKELHPAALRILHSCHQGASTMVNSAADTLYWPNMCSEVRETIKSCRSCDMTAPSQAAAPPVAPHSLTTRSNKCATTFSSARANISVSLLIDIATGYPSTGHQS